MNIKGGRTVTAISTVHTSAASVLRPFKVPVRQAPPITLIGYWIISIGQALVVVIVVSNILAYAGLLLSLILAALLARGFRLVWLVLVAVYLVSAPIHVIRGDPWWEACISALCLSVLFWPATRHYFEES
jgi:hypothetical protein